MSRIDDVFQSLRAERRTGLITYVTAGDPDLERSAEILRRLDAAGADILEVGVPFSDPLGDGPVIQRSAERAIAAGTTLVKVLGLVSDLKDTVRAPIVLYSYANPLLRMGLDEFAARARQAGVDGVLVLDVPPEESDEVRAAWRAARIDTIFLLSPTTSDERIRRAGEIGSGFLYGISRLGVTGVRADVATSARELAARVRAQSDMPLAFGFGLSRPEHVREVGEFADAAVVGSALVEVIATHRDSPALTDKVAEYVQWLRS